MKYWRNCLVNNSGLSTNELTTKVSGVTRSHCPSSHIKYDWYIGISSVPYSQLQSLWWSMSYKANIRVPGMHPDCHLKDIYLWQVQSDLSITMESNKYSEMSGTTPLVLYHQGSHFYCLMPFASQTRGKCHKCNHALNPTGTCTFKLK